MNDPGQTAMQLFFLRHLSKSIEQTCNLVLLNEIDIEDIRMVCGDETANYIASMVQVDVGLQISMAIDEFNAGGGATNPPQN